MNRRTWHWLIGVASLLVFVGLPIVGNLVRGKAREACALDGVRIERLFQVRIIDEQNHAHRFCCVRCAEFWLERQAARSAAIWVTDEASGLEIESASAYFVRSSVVTTPTSGNRVHVFRDQSDAERHARDAMGTVLMGTERPFPVQMKQSGQRRNGAVLKIDDRPTPYWPAYPHG